MNKENGKKKTDELVDAILDLKEKGKEIKKI